jgi:hypothetical protein
MYSYGKYIGKICIMAANQKVMFLYILYQSERLQVDLLFIRGLENENFRLGRAELSADSRVSSSLSADSRVSYFLSPPTKK